MHRGRRARVRRQRAASGGPAKGSSKSSSRGGPEKSVKQVVHRLAGCWMHWGKQYGYFNSEADAQAFYDEMAYMLITSFFPEWNYFSAPLLLNTLLIFVLGWLFKIYNHPRAKGIIFNIGLAIGISSFLFFPSVSFVIWVFFALMIMRPFRMNEWLLCLLGITTPYYFYAVYLFLNKQWAPEKILPYLTVNMPSLQQSIWLAASALLLMVPFLTGGYFVQENLRRMLIQVRKAWSLVLLYLLVAIFIPFVNTSNTFENWIMAAVPFAAFHSCSYFYPPRKLFPLILFWISVAFVLVYEYYGPGWN